MGLLNQLYIAENQKKIELCPNINVKDGLVNGASGEIKKIHTNENVVNIVWVHFDDLEVGKLEREDNKSLYDSSVHELWIPIPITSGQFLSPGKKKWARIK